MTGQWQPTNNLGIVAVHAALMRKRSAGEVVMWSPPRIRDAAGQPLADPQRPGQWQWYKFKLNDVESRALDVGTGNLADRFLPVLPHLPHTPERSRRDNIFCAGAAHLPDGRLFVVGGHETPPYSAPDNGGLTDNAHHMYLYDPGTGSWEKILSRLSPIRWYPTVTALPDGRVLITSGTRKVLEGNENDHTATGYWRQINNNYLIFDPATKKILTPAEGTLIDYDAIGETTAGKPERLATYPSVFVLPTPDAHGTVVALAETNRAWLYHYQPGAASPLQRANRFYPMNKPGSRSYPTYGSMVLLPLTPGESRMRILAVGGQGGAHPDHRSLNADQPATDTAEIFEVDTANPLNVAKGWRAPSGGFTMGSARVLADATLLADGSVLVSGGSKTGWGDQNYGPVYEAELFDPDTETFRPAGRASTDRRYHSTALLQLDGTLLKAGSTGGFGNVAEHEHRAHHKTELDRTRTTPWMSVHTDGERYFPPYLWRGPRPSISSISTLNTDTPDATQDLGTTLRYGRGVTVQVIGPSLTTPPRMAIIRLGSTTHGNDMDQRYVWLSVTSHKQTTTGWTLSITPPANPAA
ncbi:MAG: galactose oxidase-like domain-containing protein, partial [Sciscionella sp.]